MIFKVIWWSIKIIAVCLLVAIISNQEGITEIEWIGWKMEVPTSILIGGLIILILVILWIYNLWKIILNLPSKIFRMIRENRQKSGYNALAYGLVASSAGDVESAQKYAAQAKRLLDNKELTQEDYNNEIKDLKDEIKHYTEGMEKEQKKLSLDDILECNVVLKREFESGYEGEWTRDSND